MSRVQYKLSDSMTFATTTVESMLDRRQFYRAVRGLTLVCKAMIYMLLTNCLKWLEESSIFSELNGIIRELYAVKRSFAENDVSVENVISLTLEVG